MPGSQSASGVSPGGPRISSAKKRRLAALDQQLGAAAPSSAAQSRGGLPKPCSSASLRQANSSSGGGDSRGGGKRRSSGGGGGGEQRQQQPPEPVYSKLDEAIARGPAADALQLPRPEANSQVVTVLLEQLMATNPRAFDARAAIGLKVQDRTVMLDNPGGQRQQQGQRGRRPSRLTAQLASKREQRRQGLYQLQGAGLTYEAVQPLYRSWQQYMQELLAPAAGGGGSSSGSNDLEARLYAADLHGCLIRVVQTADKRYQGLRGIVVRDTANTLQLVTPDSRLVVVPKQSCTWEFDADRRRVVTLLGPGLVQRGTGGGGGGRPKTLREAIRGQQRAAG